jgi:hypothetical protein
MIGESGMPMMPFHHDSGECGFGQNWVVASVCDPGIGGREMGGVIPRICTHRGACMLSSWPERARAMYVIGGFAIVLCTVPQNRTSQNFSAIYSKRKCTVLCSSSPNSLPIAAVPKVPTYVWLPLGHVNPSLGEIMPPSLSCAKYCN